MSQLQEIPLSKLTASPDNVRRTGRIEGIKGLAASIKAHGLLQNLTVRKGTGETKGLFEVVAGGRRLAALQRLAKKKQIAANTRVACHVLGDENTVEISLAENEGQCPMHPADQYEAFAKLHRDHNMPAADIAARFGVTEAVVKQRLKLGAISPKLINAYRAGKMSLGALTAFAITDDHKAQERVWRELPKHHRDREAILNLLTEDKVPASDCRARFVGEDAYMAAGGPIVRDLFDAKGGGYFADPDLLNALVREKLQRLAAKVIREGWKWVDVAVRFDHELASTMRHVYPSFSAEDRAKLDELRVRESALYEAEDDHGDNAAELAAVEREIADIEARPVFQPEDIARAGVFICLDRDGTPRIERGYLRKEDVIEAASSDEEEAAEDEVAPGAPKGISDKLAAELTAHRTAALRNEVARDPATALRAVAHALALSAFYLGHSHSCLAIRYTSRSLETYAPGIEETEAAKQIAVRHELWAKRMPRDPAELWACIGALNEADLMALLAHCAALTVDAVQEPKRDDAAQAAHADHLARAVKLDMTAYWQPSAANYLGRVSKDGVLNALREGVSLEAADNLASLKKAAMVEAAAQRLAGKGWLPPLLRCA